MSMEFHYADGAFDRAAERREDSDWIAERLRDATSLFYPVWRGRCLVQSGGASAYIVEASGLAALSPGDDRHFLGLGDGVAHFAIDVSHHGEEQLKAWQVEAIEIRDVALAMERRPAALLAYSRGLVHWHQTHRFCGACGAPTRSERAGHMRRCSDESCRRMHFPRTDPAVITLVVHGEKCLLARRRVWQVNRRSTIAGFVEPGETLEDAVRREVKEEVGVIVGDVDYRASQPWPFPASLMMGFRAHAESTEITVDGQEISQAAWYSRQDIKAAHDSGELTLPPDDSISRWLVETWRAEG